MTFSPRTLEQKPFAAVGAQAVLPAPLLSQPAALGCAAHPPPVSVWQPAAVGLVVQSPLLLCVQPAPAGLIWHGVLQVPSEAFTVPVGQVLVVVGLHPV